jgi:hypothetical protein|tara:strand:- start:353 stop:646 length:294 start_codon:yes stop_codon:yes gene_type:complete
MGFDIRNIDFDDIHRAEKSGIKFDTQSAVVADKEHPLKGVTTQQRDRNTEIGDILNIGSGTRCQHCGFLHFLWRATCGNCEKPMEYNLGHRDEKNRL